MTTADAINWLAACTDFELKTGGPWRYKLTVWASGKAFECTADGSLPEALPKLVMGVQRLMVVQHV